MPTILKASTINSFDGLLRTELWYDVVVVGSYIDEETKKELPAYELTGYTLVSVAGRGKITKENGINRIILPDALGVSGRTKEHLDKAKAQSSYTLTKKEQQALQSLKPNGLPPTFQLGWERENRGPMSPTFEQSVVAENEADANGLTFTVTAPTSGNLLVICHGNNDGDANSPSLSSGFTSHVTATPPNFGPSMGMLSKISAGTEGTSIVVTHTGSEADENSGWFAEISGMKATSYTDGFNSTVDSGGDVTSRSSGSITTTEDDTLLIAAWGYEMSGTPTGFGYSDSFTPQAFIEGAAGSVDHATRIAVRTVAATGTYSSAMSFTNASRVGGVIGAFVIDVAVPPVNTVPVHTAGIYMTSDSATQISTAGPATAISVVDATGLTTCRVYCTSGDLTVTLSGSVVISAGANGSSDLTLGSGASTAEFNAVLATLTYQGDAGFHGTDTINVVSTGTGGTDTDTFNVLNDPRSLTLTASVANFASLVLATASTEMRMDTGRQSASCQVTATDDAALTDVQTIILQVAPVETVFPFRNLAVPTARRDRR